MSKSIQASKRADVRTFVLFPTSYCNMGCDYCGQTHAKTQLGRLHRDRVASRVLSALRDAPLSYLRVNWFGAEPMMAYGVIRQLAQRFVDEARAAGVRYESMIVTNGTLLSVEKIVELHTRLGVLHIEVTLDGANAVHDGHRPMKSGAGSFDTIVRVLRASLDHPLLAHLSVGLRTNVDNRNVGAVPEYLGHMARAGFGDPRVKFKFAPVHSWSNDISGIAVEAQEFANAEAGWLAQLQELGLHSDLLPTEPTGNVCVATTRSSEVISSTGNVFSCVEHPLVPEHERTGTLIPLVHLGDGELRPPGPFDGWSEELDRAAPECPRCVFLGVCGGRCPKLWHDGFAPCPSYKFNAQDRMHLAAVASGLTPRTAAARSGTTV